MRLGSKLLHKGESKSGSNSGIRGEQQQREPFDYMFNEVVVVVSADWADHRLGRTASSTDTNLFSHQTHYENDYIIYIN